MSFINDFTIKLHINTDNILTLNTNNFLTSLELLKNLDGEASVFDASPSSNSLMFGVDYEKNAPFYNNFTKGMKCELYKIDKRIGVFYITR